MNPSIFSYVLKINSLEMKKVRNLVNFNVPLFLFLQVLLPVFVNKTFALRNSFQHVLNSRHHSFQTAEVNMSSIVQLFKHFIGVLFNFVLNVHFSSLLVLLFTRKCIVKSEVVGEVSFRLLEFIIIEECIGVGNSQK